MSVSDVAIQQGLPDDRDALISLLNEGLDTRFDDEYLKWEYDDYPGFSEEHAFYIEDSESLIAFRRLFNQEIIGQTGDRFDVYTGAESVVSESYHGNGLFSRLLSETSEFVEENGDIDMSFNREGVITHEMKVRRGWNSRILPVWVKIFSPQKIIPEYAELALGDSAPTRVLDYIPRQLYKIPPADFVTAGVEFASSDAGLSAFTRRLAADDAETEEGLTVIRSGSSIIEVEQESIERLYESVTANYDYHFRREIRDLKHTLSHPRLAGVATVKRNAKIVGFAPVTVDIKSGGISQGKILDIVATDNLAHIQLVQAAEEIARSQGADILTMISDRSPAKSWARVDKQVMMWKDVNKESGLSEGSLKLGLYDAM